MSGPEPRFREPVDASRERLAQALGELRTTTGGGLGPRWMAPLVAGTFGLTLAIALRRRLRTRRSIQVSRSSRESSERDRRRDARLDG